MNLIILAKRWSGAWWEMERKIQCPGHYHAHTHNRPSGRGTWDFEFTQVSKQIVLHTEV